MGHKKTAFIITFTFIATTLSGFDARYSPSEAAVDWRMPEDETDRAATLITLDFLGNNNLMVGELAVDGDPDRPFIAQLDEQGIPVWSKRLPVQTTSIYDNLTVAGDNHLLVAYQVTEDATPVDCVGLFNPSNGFSAYYTKSLPAPETGSFFGTPRSFQAQREGKVAIVDIAGSNTHVMLLDNAANPLFAQTYELPSGGDSPFPIPGFGLSYNFATLTELSNGDFYLITNGIDSLSQSAKAVVLRLNSSGSIIWQRTIDLPASSAFTAVRADAKVLIIGNGFTLAGVNTSIVLLDASGQTEFAKSVDGALLNGFSFSHFDQTQNILLQGSIADEVTQDDTTTDGAALILSETGEKLGEAAYDLNNSDSLFHVGTANGDLYFELFGFSTDTGELTHGMLARSDSNLENWITRSYLETAGASAVLSTFFSGTGTPFLTYRDTNHDWLYVNKLDANLQETGDCDVLTDTTIVPYDPNLVVVDFSPTIANSGISASSWAEAPTLSDASFALVDTPLSVESVCATGGGGDPVSNWDDVDPYNDAGDKQTGIGWINDSHYPYVWHHGANGWIFIVPESSGFAYIVGYDVKNGFWFATSSDWQGWYYNIENSDWGINGWDYWD